MRPITGTEFVWGPAGDALADYTCGLGVGCRTRLLDVATGKVRSYDEVPLLSDIIGLTADAYLAYGTCGGFPCPIYHVDLATGALETLVDGAGGGYAALVQAAAGPLLVYEAPDPTTYRLMALNLTTSASREIYSGPLDGRVLMSSIHMRYKGVGLPPDWLGLGPYGDLLPIAPGLAKPQLLRTGDGAKVQV